MGLAFVATLALMPGLISWLERRAGGGAAGFHGKAAVAGVVFGVGATVLTAMEIFIVALLVGLVNPGTAAPEAGIVATIGGLIAGITVFAPIVGAVMPFFFLSYIVLFGVPFGLLFGVLVRALASRRP